MGIVDVYDALTTERSYKRARTPLAAFAELDAEVRRGRMSGDLVATFISIGVDRLTDLAGSAAVSRGARDRAVVRSLPTTLRHDDAPALAAEP